MTYQLHHGNMLDILPMMDRESIDSIVTDPPYGLSFMGKDWDHGVPGEHFWREAYRVAKPGAYLLAFGGTRTFHRLACAIEDAGWEIRDDVALLASMDDKQRAFFDSLTPNQQQVFLDTFASNKMLLWIYGQGFPKSHDVSKAIDKEAGAEREVIGRYLRPDGSAQRTAAQGYNLEYVNGSGRKLDGEATITSPATPLAAEWSGWGTALKPAWEPIIVARKPLQGTVAENVTRYGTGAMNIDGCRIGFDTIETKQVFPDDSMHHNYGGVCKPNGITTQHIGRWPANLIHDGSAEVLAGFPRSDSSLFNAKKPNNPATSWKMTSQYYAPQGGFNDTGSAARFFYCAKASKQDRDEGCEGLNEVAAGGMDGRNDGSMGSITMSRNHHPTVKPTSLMRYLCRLVTPPNGTVLDPFMGSGSTGKAAILEGFNFIGVDTEIEYVEIAARRIEHACEKVGIVVDQPMLFDTKRETVDRPKQLILL